MIIEMAYSANSLLGQAPGKEAGLIRLKPARPVVGGLAVFGVASVRHLRNDGAAPAWGWRSLTKDATPSSPSLELRERMISTRRISTPKSTLPPEIPQPLRPEPAAPRNRCRRPTLRQSHLPSRRSPTKKAGSFLRGRR